MILTNEQRSILEKLKKRYNYETKSDADIYNKIISAIKIIETYHRRSLWRIVEYIVLFFEFIIYPIRKQIDNKSIGVFQLKVSMLLEYLNVPFKLDVRNITIENFNLTVVYNVFVNRNNKQVLIFIMKRKEYYFIHRKQINKNKLIFFITEYSRIEESAEEFDYLFVFNFLTGVLTINDQS